MNSIIISRASASDSEEWLVFRKRLWPDCSPQQHLSDVARTAERHEQEAVFLARDSRCQAIGFLEVALRDFANGCDSSPVAFVEGVYVLPEFRQSGVAARLFEVAEEWARQHGCSELGSDTEIDNGVSQEVHRRLGFEETMRVVYFRKKLT